MLNVFLQYVTKITNTRANFRMPFAGVAYYGVFKEPCFFRALKVVQNASGESFPSVVGVFTDNVCVQHIFVPGNKNVTNFMKDDNYLSGTE